MKRNRTYKQREKADGPGRGTQPYRKPKPRYDRPYERKPWHQEEEPIAVEPEAFRLNKYIAHCGICSRRQAVELVQQGLIKVNDQVILEPWYEIQPGDVVTYKDKTISPEEKPVYILLNKPKGFITTTSDEKGRRTVLDLIRNRVKERVFPVGRLDRETTGLLLLTNDGELANKLTHPRFGIQKLYHVFLDKPVKKEHLDAILEGITLEDGPIKADKISYVQGKGENEVGIEIHSGRNRIVRRIFEHLGYSVVKLDRVMFAGLTKKDLPRGFSRPLTKEELIRLKHFNS